MPKTCIGVISTHDDKRVNIRLMRTFEKVYEIDPDSLREFQFILTGGTYNRIFETGIVNLHGQTQHLDPTVKDFILNKCGVTVLPPYEQGGVTMLSYFVTQRICSIIWQFFSAKGYAWRTPGNLALMRLCDQWHVKRLTNRQSVEICFEKEAKDDIRRNLQECPPVLRLREGANSGGKKYTFESRNGKPYYQISKIADLSDNEGGLQINEDIISYVENLEFRRSINDISIALIAHDDMKQNMISFSIDHEWELSKFSAILATGTTGREVIAAAPRLEKKVHRYHSGPKGGDIEIATEILLGRCQIVIFFIDPLNPHPHIDDIRTVFEACMIRDSTLVMTNEMHAREFLSRIVRGNSHL